jgi:hypothetical protein
VLVEGATLIRTVPGSARKLRPFSRAGPSAFHREIGVHQRIAAEVAWAVGSGPSADLQTSANRLRGVGSAGISMPHMHFAAHHPLPLRNQRAARAAAYRSLAGLAAASDEVSTLPAAEANDEAEASLASQTLFGDAAVTTMRSLVNEAYRMRVQSMAIHVLLRPLSAASHAETRAPDSPERLSYNVNASTRPGRASTSITCERRPSPAATARSQTTCT